MSKDIKNYLNGAAQIQTPKIQEYLNWYDNSERVTIGFNYPTNAIPDEVVDTQLECSTAMFAEETIEIQNLEFKVNAKLVELIKAIEDSERLLYLEDDYDDFGAVAPSESNIKSAIDFLIRYAEKFSASGLTLVVPFIGEVKNGSVELLWISWDKKKQLALTFPSDLNKDCYYFRKTAREKTQGIVNRRGIEDDFYKWLETHFVKF